MAAYYNEIEPFAAEWLQNLIGAGMIAPGDVDTRSIKDVTAADVKGYEQVHLFAGIGGWSLALRSAGWPDASPVWTGSCPCQPYSAAGKGKGDDDPRNLWPEMFRLIGECGPVTVFGEQVEAAVRHGWLDGISADLEREGYAVGSCVLGAHSVGSPHIRQRLFWVADTDGRCGGNGEEQSRWQQRQSANDRGGSGLGDSAALRRAGRDGAGEQLQGLGEGCIAVPCLDSKSRRIEPGIFPLAHGIPATMGRGHTKLERMAIRAARTNRTGRLKGYGNAIVPEVAAEFIKAFLATREHQSL